MTFLQRIFRKIVSHHHLTSSAWVYRISFDIVKQSQCIILEDKCMYEGRKSGAKDRACAYGCCSSLCDGSLPLEHFASNSITTSDTSLIWADILKASCGNSESLQRCIYLKALNYILQHNTIMTSNAFLFISPLFSCYSVSHSVCVLKAPSVDTS